MNTYRFAPENVRRVPMESILYFLTIIGINAEEDEHALQQTPGFQMALAGLGRFQDGPSILGQKSSEIRRNHSGRPKIHRKILRINSVLVATKYFCDSLKENLKGSDDYS